jgi:ribosomal protein S18 acetylase RimI-like enzyme
LRLRPARASDRALLFQVYASTRADELAVVPWDEPTKQAFLAQQFEAQDVHYKRHYPDASFELIEVDGQPAGRLYVDRRDEEIRIIDIALLPPFRGRGIGGALLSELLDEADASGRKLSIHVERENRARMLYQRLGFTVAADDGGVYLLMERPPTSS